MSHQIERLPDGHLATNEQPGALAALIAKFERGLAKKNRASRRRAGTSEHIAPGRDKTRRAQ